MCIRDRIQLVLAHWYLGVVDKEADRVDALGTRPLIEHKGGSQLAELLRQVVLNVTGMPANAARAVIGRNDWLTVITCRESEPC